jgi:hypothetical protein
MNEVAESWRFTPKSLGTWAKRADIGNHSPRPR